MPEAWWEGDPIASEPAMRPMVAHAPHEHGSWWESDPVVQGRPRSSRTAGRESPYATGRIPIGVDPRMDLDAAFNDEETATAASAAAEGLTTYGGAVAGGPIGRALASPYTWGTLSGAKALYETGDPIRAAEVGGAVALGHKGIGKVLKVGGGLISKALAARLEHQVARAAVAEAPAAASAVAEAAPAIAKATEKEIEALLLRATDSTAPPKVRLAARAALQKAGWTPEAGMVATPIVEEAVPVARKIAPIPPGKSRMATVYTRPAGLPPQQSEAARTLRSSGSRVLGAKQAEAARAAGVDIGEAFGTAAPKAEAPAAKAVLAGRHSKVILHEDPVVDAEIKKNLPAIADALEKGKGTPRGYVETGNHSGDMRPYGATDTGVKAALGLDDMPQSRKVIANAIRRDKGNDIERAVASRIGPQIEDQIAREAAPAASAAESALETRLRASVLLKKNPKALAEEIGGRVLELKDVVGPDASAIAQEIEEVYGLPSPHVKRMVEMVLREHAR